MLNRVFLKDLEKKKKEANSTQVKDKREEAKADEENIQI